MRKIVVVMVVVMKDQKLDHATLDDLDMIHQGIVNNESDNS